MHYWMTVSVPGTGAQGTANGEVNVRSNTFVRVEAATLWRWCCLRKRNGIVVDKRVLEK